MSLRKYPGVKVRRLRWMEHVAHMEERRGTSRVLVGKHEEKRPLGRHRPRWENYIRIDFHEIWDWILLNLKVP